MEIIHLRMYICSISTIPGRLSSLINVLDRFKDQTVKPDLLFITIAKYYPRLKKEYPQEDLKQLETYLETYPVPNQIMYVDMDIGPSVKLTVPLQYLTSRSVSMPTTGYEKDAIIIFDDDSVFYERGVELLMAAHEKDPNAVYGLMGVIENGDPTKPQFVHGEFVYSDYMDVDVMGGYRGVLYPVHVLCNKNSHDDSKLDMMHWVNLFIEDHKSQDMIAMHDDHIFAYYCSYRNIPKRVIHVPDGNGRLFYEPIGNTDGIFADKNSEISYKRVQDIVAQYIVPSTTENES